MPNQLCILVFTPENLKSLFEVKFLRSIWDIKLFNFKIKINYLKHRNKLPVRKSKLIIDWILSMIFANASFNKFKIVYFENE